MAKTGLMKKYITMARKAGASSKTLFKKAWSLQKRKAKTAGSIKRKTSKGVKRKVTKSNPKQGVRKMAKRKGTRRGGTANRRPRRRVVGMLSQGTINALMTGTLVAVPAIGGVWAVNQIPWVKDQKSWAKALVQGGIGIAGLTLMKSAMAKKLSSGIIAGGVMQLILPYVPNIKFGAGRRFTPAELASLQTMGRPVGIPNNGMGKPVTVPGAMAGRGRASNR